MNTRSAVGLWTRCVLLPCLALLAVAAVAMASEGGRIVATSQAGAEVCFPAKSWDAPNAEDRPCTTVYRPYEDGSGELILGSVGADAATCTIPNVYEERGHFAIQCHRVRNR